MLVNTALSANEGQSTSENSFLNLDVNPSE